MQRAYLALLLVAACSFDRSGLGSRIGDDARPGAVDAASIDGPVADAAKGTTPDARRPVDAHVDAVPTPPDAQLGVGCGNQSCSPGQLCCVSTQGGTGMQCADQCGGNQIGYACDGPEDCQHGDSCCFDRTGSTCESSCGFGQQMACRSDQDCNGGSCCPTQYPNLSLCQAICF